MSFSFGAIKNYSGMLNRISLFTFFVSLGAMALLRQQIQPLDVFLTNVLSPFVKIPTTEITVSLGTVLPAVLVVFLFRSFRLHDVVSDIFRIRQRFDVEEILKPMAFLSTGPLTANNLKVISANREKLMNDVFYRYATNRGEPDIDRHLIEMALDRWSWYWIVIEASCIAFVTSVLLLIARRFYASAVLFLCILVAFLVLKGLRYYCAKHAKDEVNAILSDAQRCTEVHRVFNAL